MSTDDVRETFAQETSEQLDEMESALLSMEEAPGDREHIDGVFRAIHTIKGAAGVFGFDAVVDFTHPVETVLDAVRRGEREVDSDLIAVLLACKDHTSELATRALEGNVIEIGPELSGRGRDLLARLSSPAERHDTPSALHHHWLIALQFRPDALRNGMDPLSFIRYLRTLGEIEEIITLTDGLPSAEQMDPESCYLGFRIVFDSDADKPTIARVFEFGEDDCDVRILPPESKSDQYIATLEAMPVEEGRRLGHLLVEIGALTELELADGLRVQREAHHFASEPDTIPRLGQILTQRAVISRPVVDKAIEKQKLARQQAAGEARLIRVDSTRLGQLIDLVGELVISSAAIKLQVGRHHLTDVEEVVAGMEHLVDQIRDHALQLRMVPIGETFARFRRVVRDVGKELDKDIELLITGGESELDKTVVEKINDPLTHLVRNALDHGIEAPARRLEAGKPARGTVRLNAYHDSGHIVIQISDDGAGLDPDRIWAKACERGLVSADQTLNRAEILRLVFEPGLSTKQQATGLSGRGVGMDVVKRNIEALRGSVEIDSEPGCGTTVTIHLPLTLAIIDGFMVGAAEERYIIPLSAVEECVELHSGVCETDPRRHYINLRGEVMPYLRLAEHFDRAHHASPGARESLVVVRFGRHKAGLVVDELYGEAQTVIKPLGKVLGKLRGISGATVLGSGDVALILDVPGLIEQVTRRHPAPRAGGGDSDDGRRAECVI